MKAWLMDVYREHNKLTIWLKTKEKDFYIEKKFKSKIYIDIEAKQFLKNFPHEILLKKTYRRTWKKVYEVPIFNISRFEQVIALLERKTQHRIALYNADVKPEQMFLYKNNLKPFDTVNLEDNQITKLPEEPIALKRTHIAILPAGDIKTNINRKIKQIRINSQLLKGPERKILEEFTEIFKNEDPDIIAMPFAFSHLPYLESRLTLHDLKCNFHRWSKTPLKYRGGKTFFSYGMVSYRDFAIRLKGRFLIDTTTTIGSSCETEAIIELCQLSGNRFQHVASRSFGAVFQSALIRTLVKKNFLVPYKAKPLDQPIPLTELFKADRGGHTLDPKVGFHKNVAEIDFCSMFPFLILNQNISADTILDQKGPFQKVPGVPVKVSKRFKGLVPETIQPFIERRMHYKRNPNSINKKRSAGLKWVLVSCYGYLRYREFKLGLAASHMAICSYAREIILAAKELAEDRGFEIIHGIVDSLYLKKKNITEEEVQDFCKELEQRTKIPISFEGIFKWISFLSSVNDISKPVPARYFGVFKKGGIKARGIEVRQKSSPILIKNFQEECLHILESCSTKKEIKQKVPELCKLLRQTIKNLNKVPAEELACTVRISKTDYKHNIPQKRVVQQLKKKGCRVYPGQTIHYLYQDNKVILPEQYRNRPNKKQYRKLLIKALYNLLQQFNYTQQQLDDLTSFERQTKIKEYTKNNYIKQVYIPISKEYRTRKGLSERKLRRRLEKQGWTTWRGGSINITRKTEIYPNVRKKYQRLNNLLNKHRPGLLPFLQYLCNVHHGMPDFICFRNGVFKFVECKLGYESLSKRQKICIKKLQSFNFTVEVHKLVEVQTKTRESEVNLSTGDLFIKERQMTLKARA